MNIRFEALSLNIKNAKKPKVSTYPCFAEAYNANIYSADRVGCDSYRKAKLITSGRHFYFEIIQL